MVGSAKSHLHRYFESLAPDAVRNLSPINTLKLVTPVCYHPCIYPPSLITIQESNWDEEIVKDSFIIRRWDALIAIFDDVSAWKANGVLILLCDNLFVISVTKLWDLIIHPCRWRGHTGHTMGRGSKLSCLTITQPDIVLPVTVKWERKNWITGKMYQRNLGQWCHICDGRSGQCRMWICMIDHHHAAFIHPSNFITLRSDLVHMVRILKIASGMS